MLRYSYFLFFLSFGMLWGCSCGDQETSGNLADYVLGITSGMIKSEDPIIVSLKNSVNKEYVKDIDATSLFDLSPSIAGKVEWIDSRTVVFRPDQPFERGTEYSVEFHLEEISPEVPEAFETIHTNFSVAEGYISVSTDLVPVENHYDLIGIVKTPEKVERKKVQELIAAKLNGEPIKIEWTTDQEEKTSFGFKIVNIQRKKTEDQTLTLQWDGSSINSPSKGSRNFSIASLLSLKLIDHKVYREGDRRVVLTFSDNISRKNRLSGFIYFQNRARMRTQVSGNKVTIYPGSGGSKTLIIQSGLKSTKGAVLKETTSLEIAFNSPKPEVRFVGEGNIIPSGKNSFLTFEAINMEAVNVSISKIFENNIPYFLQLNELAGNNNMVNFGRVIHRKVVYLDKGEKLNREEWSAFQLNLSDLISTEPGAIYRVELSISQHHTFYPIENNANEVSKADKQRKDIEWEKIGASSHKQRPSSSNYSQLIAFYGDNYYIPSYRYSSNPKSPNYYKRRPLAKNLIASNIGLIAKQDVKNRYTFFITDMESGKPASGVKVSLYNFQNQLIGESYSSDANGMVFAPLTQENAPFLVVAEQGDHKGYLRLAGNNLLSYTNYHTGGVVVNNGLKAFIYGERGVWRPGDTIYLGIMLFQKGQKIPESFPVAMTLRDARNQKVEEQLQSKGVNGVYLFRVPTEKDATTGHWQATFTVGNSQFRKALKVENIRPNRLKIKLDIADKQLLFNSAKKIAGNIDVKWLHGTPGASLKYVMDVSFSPAKTIFDKFPAFIFDDPAKEYTSKKLIKRTLGADGKDNFSIGIETNREPAGMLRMTLNTRAFEKSGNSSTDVTSYTYSPYKLYVGIKAPEYVKGGYLVTDTTHYFDIRTVDEQGNPIPVQGVSVEIYKVRWNYWWQREKKSLARYINRVQSSLVKTKKINTVRGVGRVPVQLKYPEWGRFLVRVTLPNGHSSGVIAFFDWPNWAPRYARKAQKATASIVELSSNKSEKEPFYVGEKATITIGDKKASGNALVSVENGTGIIQSFWADLTDNNQIELPITQEMLPNSYVNVMVLQPYSQTVNDAPIRLYGLLPLQVLDKKTLLEPVIDMPKTIKPEEEFSLTVTEKNDRPMTYTLAIVDEGLLDLTHFKTPDPFSSFFAKEALGVRTWDMFNSVLGKYGGSLSQILGIGGAASLGDRSGGTKMNRFKPVVHVEGPFFLKEGEKKKHHLTVSNYIGSVRAMVVAGQEGSYGNAEKTVPVKKDLMLVATLPRVLTPKATVSLPVTLFVANKNIKNVTVEVQTNDLLTAEETIKNVPVQKTGQIDVNLNLNVGEQEGTGEVIVSASGHGQKARHKIQIKIVNPNPETSKSRSFTVQPNRDISELIEPFGVKGTNSISINVSGIYPLNLSSRLNYLIRYPHGCIEQTTSAAFPQLYLNKLLSLSQEQKDKIAEHIKYAILRFSAFQVSDGGFSYWPGNVRASSWGSCYAGNFILEAEKQGYALPIGMKSQLLNYFKKRSNQFIKGDHGDYLIQAYRLYNLALAKQANRVAMNRLKEDPNMPAAACYLLASAYALAGQSNAANELLQSAKSRATTEGRQTKSYGSKDRNKAIKLQAYTLTGKLNDAALLGNELSRRLSGTVWMSTQTTAYCLMALSKFIVKQDKKPMSFTLASPTKKYGKITNEKFIYEISEKTDKSGKLKFKNNSSTPLFVQISLTGKPAIGEERLRTQNGLNFAVKYVDNDGNSIDPLSIPLGTDLTAIITVSNKESTRQELQNVALTTPFPSGWEIRNPRMEQIPIESEFKKFDYQDFKDDRVYTYFSLGSRKKQFKIHLNASYRGRFYLPGMAVSPMYDNRYNAFIPGQWITVK